MKTIVLVQNLLFERIFRVGEERLIDKAHKIMEDFEKKSSISAELRLIAYQTLAHTEQAQF